MSKPTMFLKLAFLLSLLLIVSRAQSRQIGIGSGEGNSAPDCDLVYGAKDGDTCGSVAQKFNLTLAFFSSINPNLNCDGIFIGQWLCIDGTA